MEINEDLCPCFKPCTDCTPGFEKVVDLKNAGLVIYYHSIGMKQVTDAGILMSATKTTEDIFILHNTTDTVLAPTDLLPEIEKKEVTCARCKKIINHALKLLRDIPAINKNDIIGVCDYCKLQEQPCYDCKETMKLFFDSNNESKNKLLKKGRVKEWWFLSKLSKTSKDSPPEAKESSQKEKRARSELRIDKLCRLESDKEKRELEIGELFNKSLEPGVTKTISSKIRKKDWDLSGKKTALVIANEGQLALTFSSDFDIGKRQKTSSVVPKVPKPNQTEQDFCTRIDQISRFTQNMPSSYTYYDDNSLPVSHSRHIAQKHDQKYLKSKKTNAFQQQFAEGKVVDQRKLGQSTTLDEKLLPTSVLKKQYAHLKEEFTKTSQSQVKSADSLDVAKEYQSKKLVQTDLGEKTEKAFSFYFPHETYIRKDERRKSSFELIKDTQEVLKVKAEIEKKKIEEKCKQKKEEAVNKRVAQERIEISEITAEHKKSAEDENLEEKTQRWSKENLKFDPSEVEKESPEVLLDGNEEKESKKKSKTEHLASKSLQAKLKSKETKPKSVQRKSETEKPRSGTKISKSETQLKYNEQTKSSAMKKSELETKHVKSTEIIDNMSKSKPLSKSTILKSNKLEPVPKSSKTEPSKPKSDLKMTQSKSKDYTKSKSSESKRTQKNPESMKTNQKDTSRQPESKERAALAVAKELKPDSIKAKSDSKEPKSEQKKLQPERKELQSEQKDLRSERKELQSEQIDLKSELKEPKSMETKDANAIDKLQQSKFEPNVPPKLGANELEPERTRSKSKISDSYTEKQNKNSVKTEPQFVKEIEIMSKQIGSGQNQKDKPDKKGERPKQKDMIFESKDPAKLKEQNALKLKNAQIVNEQRIPRRQIEAQLQAKQEIQVNINKIKMLKPSQNTLALDMVQFKKRKKIMRLSEIMTPLEIETHEKHHKALKGETCLMCLHSDLALEYECNRKRYHDTPAIIKQLKILKYKPSLTKEQQDIEVRPLFFQTHFHFDENIPEIKGAPVDEIKTLTKLDQDTPKGVIRYALSDRAFIDRGWTMLPTEKVVRKMNVYRMRPAHPEFDWFEHNKNKRLMFYDTDERLAEFDDNGRGNWFYRNGRMALQYYDAEELNAQQRFVIFSNGEPDERGRFRPYTVLATFDYLGNGVVFDHTGKIRLKYNQTEGVVLDRKIGPVSHWKWHTLNDPPVLQQVMIDTHMGHKDPEILKMGGPHDNIPRPDNEEMLTIEFDNFIKEKSKKLCQTFKPFQIRMKALKINEHFSLKVLDQANIYLIFRDGTTNLKVNIGMILDHKEIIDTDTAEVGEVSNNLERFPARTDSVAALQKSVAHAQRFERTRTERERRLRPPEPCASADKLTAAASRPMCHPFRTVNSCSTTTATGKSYCKSRKPSLNVYYDNRLF